MNNQPNNLESSQQHLYLLLYKENYQNDAEYMEWLSDLNAAIKEYAMAVVEEAVGGEKHNLITEKRRLTYSDVDSAFNQSRSETLNRAKNILNI